MRSLCSALYTLLLCSLDSTAAAGVPVRVTFDGEVEFNQITFGPLSNVDSGDDVQVTFVVDSDDFVNHPTFATRGYPIDESTYELAFAGGSVGLQNPFPGTPYFVLRDNDPAVDGFFVADNLAANTSIPLSVPGQLGQFGCRTSVTYGDSTLDSLDILDALGTYDFTGLTVFGFAVEDGPFCPMGMIFEALSLSVEDSAWTDQGSALAGVDGDPRLFGLGPLTDGSNAGWELDRAAPSAVSGIVLGFSSAPTPFKGGTLLPVPVLPPVIVPTDGSGRISVAFPFPPGVPAATQMWVQWIITDPAAVFGFSLSNAILGVTS